MSAPEPTNLSKVPVPAGRRMQLAIKRWLPVAFFGFSCLACLLLWQFQQRAVTLLGEVEVLEVNIHSAENGIVSAIVPGQSISDLLFTDIVKDQLVAVLDDRFLQERVNDATLLLEALETSTNADADLKPVESSVASLRKETELLLAAMQLRQLEPAETQRRQELSFEIEKIRANIGFNKATVEDGTTEPVKLRLVKQNIRSLRSELAAISVSVARLDSRSPIEGRITKLHVSPGDSVVVGQPLLTLSPTQGRHAIAYTRESSNMVPFVGMPVTIRTPSIPDQEFESRVDSVGPAIESIPSRQRALARIEEWGRPIRVRIPAKMDLAPGSLVEILVDSSALSQ